MSNRQNKCFISLVIKALGIKKKFKLYTSEKEFAKSGNENQEINKCLGTKLSESFNTLINTPKNVRHGFFNRFLVEDSVENYVIKSVFGFLGGIFLTYVCFMFLIFSLNFTLKRATYICIGLGVILSLGLAFSIKIRCTVFLCIPQLFSKRGRQALLAYAFILALSGPAKNTLHNVEVMSESLACTQEQLKQAENDLLKCVQKPNAAAKKTIEKLLEKINSAVKDFKNFILQLYKNCFDILETVLHAQKWLYSITLLCQKKMGRPAHRCLNLLAETKENCEQVLPIVIWKQLCGIGPQGQKLICSTNAKFVCLKGDVRENLPVLKLQKQLNAFKHRAMNILYVNIEGHQTYSQTNRSYTYHEEYQGMATEIRQKTDQFLQYFDFMSVIFGIFILVLFIKVIIYRHKFLTEDHYDNRYITSDFVDIDNTRAAFRMQTLLPLLPREKMQYIKVTSVRLVPCERVRLLSSFVFLIFATFKIIVHMLTDSSLYWILSTVRRNERFLYMSTLGEEEPIITVQVVGDGLVAELFRNVTRAVKRESALNRLDPTPCLPDPVPPDWNRYYQILALVLICWLLALCEPYGLRLRHSVMVTYHPDRARERAIWLYNRIISNRIRFVKISRRKLRREYKDLWLEDTFRYKFMRKASSPKCLLCKTTIGYLDNYVKCPTPQCVGLYCALCFTFLKFCSICTNPAEYGDLSDLSEEKDSSEEDYRKKSHGRRAGARKKVKNKGISLNLKKIKLKEAPKSQMTHKSHSENLIQPNLLHRALKYCRSKMPSFRKLRALSDFESSDWEHESSLTTEGSSVEEKLCDVSTRRTRSEANGTGSERKSRRGKKKQGMDSAKKARKKEEIDGDHKMKSVNKSEQNMQKVCIFKKVPSASCSGGQEITKNEFGSKTETVLYSEILEKDNEASNHSLHVACRDFQLAKDSLEMYRLKSKKSVPESCRKCDSGVLVNDEIIESEIGETKFQARLYSQESGSQIIVDPLELEAKYSEQMEKYPTRLPFIDPVNIHEIDLGTDSDGECYFVKKKSDSGSGGEEGGALEKTRSCRIHTSTSMLPYTPHCTRECCRTSESSESLSGSVKVNLRGEDTNSGSSESECEFYYRPFRSPQTYLRREKTNSGLKRASGKVNLKASKLYASYSVETDSSNDNFLSVKPSRRAIAGPDHEKDAERGEREHPGNSGKNVKPSC